MRLSLLVAMQAVVETLALGSYLIVSEIGYRIEPQLVLRLSQRLQHFTA